MDVTAVDLPITFEFENVQALASGEGIALLQCADLARADVLDVLPTTASTCCYLPKSSNT